MVRDNSHHCKCNFTVLKQHYLLHFPKFSNGDAHGPLILHRNYRCDDECPDNQHVLIGV